MFSTVLAATHPNSPFESQESHARPLERENLVRESTGISNLSPEYVCGAPLTRIPVPLRAFP